MEKSIGGLHIGLAALITWAIGGRWELEKKELSEKHQRKKVSKKMSIIKEKHIMYNSITCT